MAEVGDLIVWSKVFTNAAGAGTDPDVVTFFLREEVDGTELEWSYTTSGAVTTSPTGFTSVIVRASAGTFSLSEVGRKPERLTGWWRGAGTIFQARPLTIFVRHSLIHAIEPQ
jgi:hypothetical protein